MKGVGSIFVYTRRRTIPLVLTQVEGSEFKALSSSFFSSKLSSQFTITA